jgi:hypothetical protein
LERKEVVVSMVLSPEISLHRSLLYKKFAWKLLSERVSDMGKYEIRDGVELESFGGVRYSDEPSRLRLIE